MKKRTSFKQEFEGVQSSYREDPKQGRVRYRSVSALVDGLRCEAQTRGFKLTIDER